MLKTIGLVLLAAIVLVLGFAATRPDSFRLERSLRMQAPPEKILPLINDLHTFNTWNPWVRKEPSARQTYSGPPQGPGARAAWEGKELGSGSMTITAVEPTKVTLQLDFLKPFEAHNVAEFTLTPAADGTTVVWAMHGPANYMTKVMGLFFSMDAMVGKDFEDGLANLKQLAEAK